MSIENEIIYEGCKRSVEGNSNIHVCDWHSYSVLLYVHPHVSSFDDNNTYFRDDCYDKILLLNQTSSGCVIHTYNVECLSKKWSSLISSRQAQKFRK